MGKLHKYFLGHLNTSLSVDFCQPCCRSSVLCSMLGRKGEVTGCSNSQTSILLQTPILWQLKPKCWTLNGRQVCAPLFALRVKNVSSLCKQTSQKLTQDIHDGLRWSYSDIKVFLSTRSHCCDSVWMKTLTHPAEQALCLWLLSFLHAIVLSGKI